MVVTRVPSCCTHFSVTPNLAGSMSSMLVLFMLPQVVKRVIVFDASASVNQQASQPEHVQRQ